MDRDAFVSALRAEGFSEFVLVTREPGELDTHTHAFEAKALILEGEIHIRAGGAERVYRPGDTFHLAANAPHTERYGPQGVQYLVARR
ncbi:cupin domain-containing protein [Ralstonia sp. Ralssp110]|uniref:cupin domain-containing protein n=1 Tax=Ralstonia sp. Ralssp110 TaxID=3243004 RepID=UPI0039B43BC1